MQKLSCLIHHKEVAEPSSRLEADPNNPLAVHMRQVNLSREFIHTMFCHIDPMADDARQLMEQKAKCDAIINDNPQLFIKQSSHELDREAYRILTLKQ